MEFIHCLHNPPLLINKGVLFIQVLWGVCFNDITQCFAFCIQKIYIYHSLENIVDGLLLRLQSISTVKGTDCAIAQMFGSAEMEKVAKDFTPIVQK